MMILCKTGNVQQNQSNMISTALIQKFRNYYAYHSSKSYVVNPAIPIIYFGDEPAYRKSKIKVVTVYLNTSDNEFTET